MNTKASWILLALVLLAVMFVPIVPDDSSLNCTSNEEDCEQSAAYVSVYTKYFSK